MKTLHQRCSIVPVTGRYLDLPTRQTRHDPQARYAAKWRLARLLYERDWDKQRIIDRFAVLDWLLHLPEALERKADSR